jgi:membrane-associated HD superfamily phosphohydrolase
LTGDLILGFSSGILAGIIATGVVPLIEVMFSYTTDIKLLELGNLNHPLLKELVVEAPGTYHHSILTGSLVEAAAESIGANPLLTKVGAYYHDIGK